MELIPAQVNSGCAVDRHSQRAAWCPDVLFPRSCSLRMNTPVFESSGLITTLMIMVGHRCTYADMSTRQSHTLQLQQQQQSFNTHQLTPVKCRHLLSHEMTGQVDSGALDLFLCSPHVVSYPAQQQQSFNTHQLRPMKCPHHLSHEMTGQVDSGALDLFLCSPHVVSYPAQQQQSFNTHQLRPMKCQQKKY